MSWGMESNFSEKVPVHTPTEVVGGAGVGLTNSSDVPFCHPWISR